MEKRLPLNCIAGSNPASGTNLKQTHMVHSIEHLPINQQIEITEWYLKNSDDAIKHYSKNPLKLDDLKFKIQTQSLSNHNQQLNKKLKTLKQKQDDSN